jgi:excisionase family DNA binding protein
MHTYSLLTIKEVADLLKLNTLTVYEYVRDGHLQAVKLGRSYRVDYSDLIKFIKAHRVQPRKEGEKT